MCSYRLVCLKIFLFFFLRCVIPVVLSNNKKSKIIYIYIVKHNFILGGMCYYTKAQLHVSAIKVDHLQVVHENLSIGYTPHPVTPQTRWYSLLISSHVQPEDGQH
jgi:hypothetical protein